MPRQIVLCLFLLPASLAAQAPFPLQEIDEITWIGAESSDRHEAQLGLAVARAFDERTLLLQGREDSGRPWTVRLPRAHRDSPRTRVFRGDLDANGREDLLIAAMGYGNGRCVEGGTITTLLFDAGGEYMTILVDIRA